MQNSGSAFLKTFAIAAFALFGFAASADTAPPPEDMNVVDQPGYVPSADETDQALNGPYQRQEVFFRTTEPAGVIIIDTSQRYLYLVQGGNRAIRYGIGVGRDGFTWSGMQKISRKQEWPDWRPPPEMIERQPYLPRFMAGGPGNPWAPARSISGEGVPHSRHQPTQDDRACGLVGLLPSRQRRRHRPVRPRTGRHEGHHQTSRRTLISSPGGSSCAD